MMQDNTDRRDGQHSHGGITAAVRQCVAAFTGDDAGDRTCGKAGSGIPNDIESEDLIAREVTDSLEQAVREYAIDHSRFAGVDYQQNGELHRVVTPVVPRQPEDIVHGVRNYYNGTDLYPDAPESIREVIAESDALALFPVQVKGESEPRCSLYYTLDGGDVDDIPQNHLLSAQRAVELDGFVYDGGLPGDPPRR